MPKKTFYITTAIDYPNAKPHIGHAYEKVVADMIARWHRLRGERVFFLTGTDEHGQKIEKAAAAVGKKPQEFVNEMSALFEELCKRLDISNDDFIRTTQKRHVKTAVELFTKVFDKGLIYKDTYTGLYCTGCEAFYLERELDNGHCTIHKRKCEMLSEQNYFFKMSVFQEQLKKHIQDNPFFIQPQSKRAEILARLEEPLRDLCVTRTGFKWGIAIPQDKTHIIYVWFDALINYLSGVAYPTRKYQTFWPANCHLIGKDIVWFHTVIWGSMLLALDIPLPKSVVCHGFLTVDGHKMSKSLGNVVDPITVIDSYGCDALRYFLLRDVSSTDDGDFSEAALVSRVNADLADSLGNLLQRVSVLVHKNFNGTIPACGVLGPLEKQLHQAIPDIAVLNELIDAYAWHHVVEHIWNYIHACNKYVNDAAPWKENGERLSTILYTITEHLRIIGILISPIIPSTAERVAAQIGQKLGTLKDVKFKKTTTGLYAPSEILFKKLEVPEQDPFSILDLRVAEIIDVAQHPNADKLYVVKLNAGDHQRQLVAGMKPYYSPDQLIGKHIVFISNLKPAQLRGVESQGMLLAAEKDGKVNVLEAPATPAGERVFVSGISSSGRQITIDDFKTITLTTKNGVVVYGDKPLQTAHETIRSQLGDGATIR